MILLLLRSLESFVHHSDHSLILSTSSCVSRSFVRNCVGILLAGGRARPMGGGDKALQESGGISLLAHAIAALRPQCEGLVLSANGDPKRFAGFDLPIVATICRVLWARSQAHRDTLSYLKQRISTLLGRKEAVVCIHGGMGREERMKTQESRGSCCIRN